MAELNKVIKGLESCQNPTDKGLTCECIECPYECGCTTKCRVLLKLDALELLKEQQKEIDEIANEYIDFGKEMVKQPKIVRCKDCKHGEKPQTFKYYPNLTWCNKIECTHDDDWFCADGELKDALSKLEDT